MGAAKINVKRINAFFKEHGTEVPFSKYADLAGNKKKISDVTYYKYRKDFKESKPANLVPKVNQASESDGDRKTSLPDGFKPMAKKRASYEECASYIRRHPDASLSKIAENTTTKLSSNSILRLRHAMKGSSVQKRQTSKKNPIYMTVYTKDSTSLTEASKVLLKDFIATLNDMGRTRFEFREYSDPKEIEIREVQ